ncbi:MAG: hypothetical protein Q7S61_06075, partial [bacterium]|nr:hypothetical protein [bacterium]
QTGFDNYLDGIRTEAKAKIIGEVKARKMSPPDLDKAYELEASQMFLYRTMARVVSNRMPTKFVRIDRDRYSQDGTSRWKDLRQKMGVKLGQPVSTEEFDKMMKRILLAESLLRKETTEKMDEELERLQHTHAADGKENAKDMAQLPDKIEAYRLTEAKLRHYLTNLPKMGYTAEDIEQSVSLFKELSDSYSGNEAFLNSFAKYIRTGGYPFSFAVEETESKYIVFRNTGPRTLSRLTGEIGQAEIKVVAPILGLPALLQKTALSGKKDFNEIVNLIGGVKTTLEAYASNDYAQKVAHHLAAVTMSYFKKDTLAKGLLGIFNAEEKHSLAAEFAGTSNGVWEWDSIDIDRFCDALDRHPSRILPKQPYNPSKKPDFEPTYITNPLNGELVKLPDQFNHRKKDYEWFTNKLRNEFGGAVKGRIYDLVGGYIPIALVGLFLFYMFKAFKDWTEQKK